MKRPDPRALAIQAVFLLQAFAFASWLPRLPALKLAFGLSEGAVGALLMALPAGALAGSILAGVLTVWLPLRVMILVALCAMTWAVTLIGIAPNATVLAGVLVLVGLCAGSIGVAMNAGGVAVERALGRPVLLRCHAMFSVGLALGALLAGAAVGAGIGAFAHLAGVALLVTGVMVGLARWLPGQRDAPAEAGPRFALPSGAVVIPALIAGGAMVAEGATMDWSSIFLRTVLEAPAAAVGYGVAAFSGAMALMRFFGDGLTARLGDRSVVIGGALIGAVGYAAVATAQGYGLALAGYVLIGLGMAPVMPTAYRVAARVAGAASGMAIAATSTAATLGFLLGPPIVGFVAELGTLRLSFLMIAAVLAGVALLGRAVAKPAVATHP